MGSSSGGRSGGGRRHGLEARRSPKNWPESAAQSSELGEHPCQRRHSDSAELGPEPAGACVGVVRVAQSVLGVAGPAPAEFGARPRCGASPRCFDAPLRGPRSCRSHAAPEAVRALLLASSAAGIAGTRLSFPIRLALAGAPSGARAACFSAARGVGSERVGHWSDDACAHYAALGLRQSGRPLLDSFATQSKIGAGQPGC